MSDGGVLASCGKKILAMEYSSEGDNFSDEPDPENEELLEGEETGCQLRFLCPLDDECFDSKEALNQHLNSKYRFSLETVATEKSPLSLQPEPETRSTIEAYLYYCILVNFLRRQRKDFSVSAAQLLQIIDVLDPDSDLWKDDSLLQPVIPDDPVIRCWDGWRDASDDDSVDDEMRVDPYQPPPREQRFAVAGEAVPSREFLAEQARGLRDLGAFD
eukprot:Gregarina_sp_Poly_1__4570@NODE_244_length_10763_cov_79_258975_g214_i0_p4_GENE_NODE_244_length_10763_cov_79_258975_g214_i0NODE_244_length_10763_cov_79_258975_g214_i0_p4_ORF_typecomplete_len216_score35_59_NODE_244_length_10763_cov_79_258975_g214_i060916738